MKFLTVSAISFLVGLASASITAEELLVYVYQEDCGACMKFEKEIAPIYPQTSEAKQLPMVKVSLEDWRSGNHPYDKCETGDVFGTPTFIQLSNCREIDRITGYSSDELFWLGLARMNNQVSNPS